MIARSRLVLVLAAAALGSAACGSGGPPSIDALMTPNPFYQGTYLGRTVTVTGDVVARPTPVTLELGSGYGPMTVLARDPVTATPGSTVRVTGTVGQLQHLFPEDKAPYTQDHLYRQSTTDAYLYDATIEPAG